MTEVLPLPKAIEEFRNYEDSDRHNIVVNHYKEMRKNQTYAFVEKMHKKYFFAP